MSKVQAKPAAPGALIALNARAAEALAEALETMAFITPLPPDGPAEAPAEALRVAIDFCGPVNGGAPTRGTLELLAPPAFAAILAANLLGSDPADAAETRGADALKELMNVACGVMLAGQGRPGAADAEIALPTLAEPADHATWLAFAATPGATTLDAEGHPIVIRARVSD